MANNRAEGDRLRCFSEGTLVPG